MPTYRFRDGHSVGGLKPEQVKAELVRIRGTDEEQPLAPQKVVDEARPKGAVLHPAFEWNDKVAGEQYRLGQARSIIRVVIVQPDEPERAPRPYFIHVAKNEYQPTEMVVERVDLFERALVELQRKLGIAERAIRELESAARESANPERMAAIGLAAQGFETVREALAILK